VFPDWLYPYSSQYDPSRVGPREICPRPFDPLSPTSWWQTAKMLGAPQPTLVLLQYWHPYFAPALVGLTRALQRVSPQARVGLLCHNALPHDPFPMQRPLARALFDAVDVVFTHGAAGKAAIEDVAPGTPTLSVSHPVYRTLRVAEPLPTREARERLALPVDRPTLLMLGHVRPYKNVDGLLDALALLSPAQRPTVLLAGAWLIDDRAFRDKCTALGLDAWVVVRDGYVPNEDLPTLFGAADATILPYKSATQSGAAHLSFAFERPVIVTDVGSLSEAVDDGVTGRVVPPDDPPALAAAIEELLQGGRAQRMQKRLAARGGDDGWRQLAERLRAVAF
jgi:D-inositol-3-phosphate glycosyltransferase